MSNVKYYTLVAMVAGLYVLNFYNSIGGQHG